MKYKYSKNTKTYKLQKALMNGDVITAAQAEKRFGIKNMTAEIFRIRRNGFAVYGTARKAGNGVEVFEYHMGNPTRELIALGYIAKQMGLDALL